MTHSSMRGHIGFAWRHVFRLLDPCSPRLARQPDGDIESRMISTMNLFPTLSK
jgi:hypothetical protein